MATPSGLRRRCSLDVCLLSSYCLRPSTNRVSVCESAGYPEWNGTYNTGCLQNQNPDNVAYKDLSPGNWLNRQWFWMLCNEPYVPAP